MPTDIRCKKRRSQKAETLDALLASACRALIAVAISLATLIVVELEITSWRAGGDQSGHPDLQLMVTSP